MGRFFSNIHIKKDKTKTKQQFSEVVNKIMKKRGYGPSSEDDSSLSYILAFSENNKWATLSSSEYEAGGQTAQSDVKWFAEALKTCCISTAVVDSDFAILEMYNGTSSMIDRVIVGDGEDYGFANDSSTNGKRVCWEPLLTENSSFEQLSEIWNGDYTFAEEALGQMAPLLGMDSKNIVSDYEDFDMAVENNPNVFTLYFKKANKKSAPSLNAVFKKVFGEALEPLGFKKIKGRQPYFVRVVEGGEIIHVITCREERSSQSKHKEFDIECGVATVYRESIDLTISPKRNGN